MQLDIDIAFLVDHLMLQVPASTPAEMRNNRVAVAQQVNVEVNVSAWLVSD